MLGVKIKVRTKMLDSLARSSNDLAWNIVKHATIKVAEKARDSILSGQVVPTRTGLTRAAYQARPISPKRKKSVWGTRMRAAPLNAAKRGTSYLGRLQKIYKFKNRIQNIDVKKIINDVAKKSIAMFKRNAKRGTR